MADYIVPIRSVKQYMNEFVYGGIIERHEDPSLVRNQLLDAFQKEIFGQIVLKYHDATLLAKPTEQVSEDIRTGCRNIIDQANRKWRRLCIEVGKYKQTRSMIDVSDLNNYLNDVVEIQENKNDSNAQEGKLEE